MGCIFGYESWKVPGLPFGLLHFTAAYSNMISQLCCKQVWKSEKCWKKKKKAFCMWAHGPGEAEAACGRDNPRLDSLMKTSLVRHQPSPGNKSPGPALQECLQSALTPEAVCLQSPSSLHVLLLGPGPEQSPSQAPPGCCDGEGMSVWGRREGKGIGSC